MPAFIPPLRKGVCALTLIIAACTSWQACADIVISGTRIIYPQTAKDVTVNLQNRGNKPLLVQSWLDDGRDTVDPQQIKLPFVITPPVSRVDPQQGQAIRITWLGQALPKDRESLLWFNVLEVPPKAKTDADRSRLQLAFRTRIKLFFRPEGLAGSPAGAIKQLSWQVKRAVKGTYLVASNHTPWNISLASASFITAGKTYVADSHAIKPFSSEEMKINGATATTFGTVKYVAINDFGGTEEYQSAVN
ncbi:fimbrial chaperone [Leclercia sp.]|uniref:fimbrial chaperone n=1 Tax=Leclercia sp. TaxID=1898428 RepID=UPI002FDD45B9